MDSNRRTSFFLPNHNSHFSIFHFQFPMPTTLITDTAHYSTVLDMAMKAKKTLWIGTADIKELYVTQGKTEKPFLGVLAELLGKGVVVRQRVREVPTPQRVPGSDCVRGHLIFPPSTFRLSHRVKTLFLFAPHTYGVLNPVAK